MKTLMRRVLCLLLLALPAFAQEGQPPPEDVPLFSQAELDQMLAPIALYPDQLLAQVMMAATYPLEVVQAARWSRENPQLQGQDAVRVVDDKAWDPSVKSLVAFPNVLSQMDADLDWTERLGDAFLAQQGQVMATVQNLREKAYETGNLRSGEHVEVVREREVIVVRPARPEVVYVPYYDPRVVYGSWWWPQYRPMYWSPWPGYGMNVGYNSYGGFWWGSGITLGTSFFFGGWDWHDHHVHVVDYTPFYYRRPPRAHHGWEHDYRHRRGVPYRHQALEQRYRPHDGRPVRRHDYGDHRDRDRNDYRDGGRNRDGDGYRERDRDGDGKADGDRNRDPGRQRDGDRDRNTPRGGQPGQDGNRPGNEGQRPDDRGTPTAPAPGRRDDRDADTPDRNGNGRPAEPRRGQPGREARQGEDLARPARPGTRPADGSGQRREEPRARTPDQPRRDDRQPSGQRITGASTAPVPPQEPRRNVDSRPPREARPVQREVRTVPREDRGQREPAAVQQREFAPVQRREPTPVPRYSQPAVERPAPVRELRTEPRGEPQAQQRQGERRESGGGNRENRSQEDRGGRERGGNGRQQE